jgi:hypothetical protein
MKINETKNSISAMLYCLIVLVFFGFVIINPVTREIYKTLANSHPYILGFIKFALLATSGEIIAIKLAKGSWDFPIGMIQKMGVWGFLGIAISVIFKVDGIGVAAISELGMLPGSKSAIGLAFYTSVVANLGFAPIMMAFHRFTDTWIDRHVRKESGITVANTVAAIDWSSFVTFALIKTIPIFWIPIHTITFSLPGEYRTLMAAISSVALGAILGYANKSKKETKKKIKED